MILVLVLLSLLSILLVAWWLVPLWERWIPLDRTPDETHLITTEDGWQLILHRYKPTEEKKRNFPVLLCHGLGVGSVFMDFDKTWSLARYLREEGFDCWTVDLRSSSAREIKPPTGKKRYDFSFDCLVEKDVPAAIQEVQKHTGAAHLHWVGHSMGGMVLYSSPDSWEFEHTGSKQTGQFRSVVTLGSPSRFHRRVVPLYPLHPVLKWIPALPSRFFTRIGLWVAPYLVWAFGRMIRPGSQPASALRYSCLYMFANMSGRLLMQFAQMIKHERLCREDGELLYDQRLQTHRSPAMFVVGDKDGMAPWPSARYAYDQWKGKKEWVWLSPSEGTESYGHGDMVLGRTAPQEVFPKVARWLKEHD